MSNIKKKRKKSIFEERLNSSAKKAEVKNLTVEETKARSLSRLEQVFLKLGNKENTYLFYCPDMPFGTTSVKAIYEFAYKLQKLGFSTKILHEGYGFKANWFKDEWVKDVKIDYIQGQNSAKSNKRAHENANYRFNPTDTIIIPEGFWSLTEQFKDIKPLNKIILALGYGGLMTAEPGLDWSHFGFTDVICLTERLKQDYQLVWPHFTYHVVPYSINQEQFSQPPIDKVYPAIGLSIRNREEAQAIINIFYNRYPYLDLFEFKVLKKLDTKHYAETLRHCACLLFIDQAAGCPAPPLEAISAGVPIISVFGRGVEHLAKQPGIQWVETSDFFVITEVLAAFCIQWLQGPTVQIEDKTVLENFSDEKVNAALLETFNNLQQTKIQTFTAIKNAIEANQINYSADDIASEIEEKDSITADDKYVQPIPEVQEVSTDDLEQDPNAPFIDPETGEIDLKKYKS